MTRIGWLLVVLLGLAPGLVMAQDTDGEGGESAGETDASGSSEEPGSAGEPAAAEAAAGEEADGAEAEEADEGVGAPAGDAEAEEDGGADDADGDGDGDSADGAGVDGADADGADDADGAPIDESLTEEERLRAAREEYERRRRAWQEREAREERERRAAVEAAEAERAEAAAKRKAALDAHKKKMMAMPQLALHLGGQQVKTFDPGWGAIGDSDHVESFSAGLDVWLHPNIGLSLAWSDSGELKDNVAGREDASSLAVTARVRTFDAGAKAALAPRWLPVRPIARAAFGVRGVELDVVDNSTSGNLAGRMASGAAPYGRFGAGLELLTPRYFGKSWRSPGAQKTIRWGAGFMVEAGAEIGGGGDVPAASSVDLGEFGRLDVGPWYVRAGLVLLF